MHTSNPSQLKIFSFCICLIAAFMSVLSASAQRIDINSALQNIQTSNTEAAKMEARLVAANAYLLVNVDSAIYYASTVLQYAEKEKQELLKADASLALGEAYSYVNQQIQAIEYLLDARDYFEATNNKQGLGDCFFALGELYSVIKYYDLSKNYFFRAIEQFYGNKSETSLGNAFASLGDTYYSEKNFSLGEILILNTLLLIDDVTAGSMLLIDELEMALHPRVQIRLLKYLENKAIEKNLVIILSTHSSSLIKSAKKLICFVMFSSVPK